MFTLLTSPPGYWVLAALGVLAYVYVCAKATVWDQVPTASPRVSDAISVAVAVACFLLLRWPTLFATEIYIDESQMLAQAMTALHDPVPWVAFDGTTSGPFNTYVLLIPRLLGISFSIYDARIVSTALSATLIVAQYYVVRPIYGGALARLSLFVPIVLFGLGSSLDLRMYASELLPIVLMTIALALAAAIATHPDERATTLVTAGACCGAIPFAKLQGILLAAMVAALILAAIWRRGDSRPASSRRTGLVVVGAAIPALFILGAVAIRGGLYDFYESYIAQAFAYSTFGMPARLETVFLSVPEYRTFFPASASVAVILLALLIGTMMAGRGRERSGPPSPSLQLWIGPLASLALLAVAWYSVRAPQRDYAHYWLLVVEPLTLVVVSLAGALTSARRAWSARLAYTGFALYLVIVAVPVAALAAEGRPDYLAAAQTGAVATKSAAALRIGELAPGGRVAIWGYSPQLFVDSGSLLGTRDSVAQFTITPGPLQGYYRARFLSDLRANKPPLFIDSVGSSDFNFFNPDTEGLKSFPELAAYVGANYELAADVDDVRIYRIRTQS